MNKTNKASARKVESARQMEKELGLVNSRLNNFLQEHFTLEADTLGHYLLRVRDLLVDLTTRDVSPLISNIFSKISNILQPFNVGSMQVLREEGIKERETGKQVERRIARLREEVTQLRAKSSRLMDFVYALRVNNINVDEIYRKSIGEPNESETEYFSRRQGVNKEEVIFNTIEPVEITVTPTYPSSNYQTNLTVKTKR